MSGLEHGGRLAAARRRFPDAPQPWMDLSTGINPVPYPLPPLPPALFARLPDPDDLRRLQAVAAEAFGAPDPSMVAALPGTQAAISVLPLLFRAQNVAVVTPAYGEHAACWAASGAAVRAVSRPEELAGAEIGVLCNPNNPDGRRWPPEALLPVARRVGLLVVDEAYIDLEPGVRSCAPLIAEAPQLLGLRSFGKSYGLAGARLGFAIAGPPVAERLRGAFGPWPVSGPALAIGERALADGDWLRAAAERARADAARLQLLLARAGLRVIGGTSLFVLAETDRAAEWCARLGEAGILVRSFEHAPAWLRFGLPGDEAAWRRLETVMRG
ncbi:MAG: threonine-phosphate decarboxylase, partial [Acetobacteraceae bacterium]|nr:threonine-phosphate decarboxylase [Acetobacteraceae bacterium]